MSMGNTMPVLKNPLEHREQLQKIPLNLIVLYETGSRSVTEQSGGDQLSMLKD